MSQLASAIEKAADAFARSIITAVQVATLQELFAVQGGAAPAATGGKRRGRPPKAKPGRKPGRPPKGKPGRKPGRPAKAMAAKATAKKSVKKAAKAPARKKRRKINYPKCSVPGCGKNRYARGNGMCGEHFKAAQAATGA
ncbi:MAG: hypothetical protein M0R80_17105 [Proteobacteria bacterium]|jgi:hypothetical protein|nr:hypothetical protein [Pseudomonadota bacterium]